MKSKWLSKLKIFGLLVLGLVAIHFIFFRAPSEAQMLNNFHIHRAEFEQISSMMQQDSQVRYISSSSFDTMDWKMPNPEQAGISSQRLDKYRALMKQVGINAIIRIKSKHNYLRCTVFGGGFIDTSWSIGYSWSDEALEPLVKSAYRQRPRRSNQHFSHIEGNWYIYHLR